MKKLNTEGWIGTNLSVLTTLKNFLRQNFVKGCECPVCGQNVKAYKRTLNSNMARALIIMYRLKGREYLHVQQEFTNLGLVATSMDYIQLARWNFIEAKPNPSDSTKKDSGYWRITDAGVRFIDGGMAPKYCLVYNNKTYSSSDERVTIRRALGTNFSFDEVWNIV